MATHFLCLLQLTCLLGVVWTRGTGADLIHTLEVKVKLLEQQQNEDRAMIRRFLSATPNPSLSPYERGTAAELEELREMVTNLVRERKKSDDVSEVVKELREENDNLRADVTRLKSEVERVKERREETSGFHQQVVAVRWLQKSVERIRGEIAEVAAAQNVSAALRQQQRVDAQLQLIHADITWLRADAEQQRAQQEKLAASLEQVEVDVDDVREQENRFNERWQKLKEELLKVQDELKRPRIVPPIEVEDDNSIHDWPVRLRHDRRLRKMVNRMTVVQEQFDHELNLLRHNQTSFATETRRLNKQISVLRNETQAQWKAKFAVIDAMRIRLASLESVASHMTLAVHNVTSSSATLGKLHASTVQLFEALESVESTCVSGIGTLRREVSKMEFNVGQLTSALTILKEDENAYEHTLQVPDRQEVANQVKEQQEQEKRNFYRNLFHEEEEEDVYYPKDCSELDTSHEGSTVISLRPNESFTKTIQAVCDLDSSGVMWTVVQRHYDLSFDFDRTWDEYVNGFGNLATNLWLGNDAIHAITSSKPHILHIDLWDNDGQYRFAEYDTFKVSSKKDFYKLTIGGFQGNASDAFRLHTGAAFSTKDLDNDSSASHCSQLYGGGWWYARCQYVNLNSNLESGFIWFDVNNNVWIPLSRVQMKIRVKN
uniref:Fibrinogen C-terminal domain-containing protein n=1 Tax=Strigamia maritima TaxID=126957 RepID=T1IKD3_STRMM